MQRRRCLVVGGYALRRYHRKIKLLKFVKINLVYNFNMPPSKIGFRRSITRQPSLLGVWEWERILYAKPAQRVAKVIVQSVVRYRIGSNCAVHFSVQVDVFNIINCPIVKENLTLFRK